MKIRDYLALGLLGLAFVLSAAYFQDSPGYMDADYYFAGGLNLVRGKGFTEDFLWNYLYDPDGLPAPSNAYWMPLASIVSAAGMLVTGEETFTSARLFFTILAALLGPLTAWLSYSIFGNRRYAILAGAYAAIPGFYLAYMGTTDVFGLYMLLGGLWFLMLVHPRVHQVIKFLFLGLISGLMHLTRADGLIWLGVGLITILLQEEKTRTNKNDLGIRQSYQKVILIGALVSGYLLVMGPWMIRNAKVFGSLLSPGGVRSIWLTNYDDLYSYPGTDLTMERWLESGIGGILRARLQALSMNLQTSIVVQGEIFLTPLILIGAVKAINRHRRIIQITAIGWILTFVVMTFVFPEVGWRGGFFHSSTALQMMFWVFAPFGLDGFVDYGGRIRGWNKKQAWTFFQFGTITLAILLTLFIAGRRVVGESFDAPVWNESALNYAEIEKQLIQLGANDDDTVLVNNPPGYYINSGRSALVIPNGDLNTLVMVAKRYSGDYLILEENHPRGLETVYQNPLKEWGLVYLKQVDSSYLFKFTLNK